MVQRWVESASRKVCLAVEDEDELEYYLERVQEASLPFAVIKDAGLTEVAPGTVTVLGVAVRLATYHGRPVWKSESIRMRRNTMGFRSFIHRITAPKFERYIHRNQSLKMVFVINHDLKMGKGKIAAQVGHAAVKATPNLVNIDLNSRCLACHWPEKNLCEG